MPDLFNRLPKYIQIKEALRQEIDEGILREGQQLASEAVLIDRFGASKMTVIRALHELVQEGYLRRVQGKGTYVTRPIRKTPLIGVMIPSMNQGMYGAIAEHIIGYARKRGYETILCCTNNDDHQTLQFVNHLLGMDVSGLIAIPLEDIGFQGQPLEMDINRPWLEKVRTRELPLIFVERELTEKNGIPSVLTNNQEIMAELTQEVIRRGHRRILLIGAENRVNSTMHARIQGFHNGIEQKSRSMEFGQVIFIDWSQSSEEIQNSFYSILKTYEPTAIMSLSDEIAFQICCFLRHGNPSPYVNISLTGFGDLPFARTLGLTTVIEPVQDEGCYAVETLHRVIQQGSAESVILPSRIVIRSSLFPAPE